MDKKVCVVGAGYWGQNHIRTLDKLVALGGIVELDNNLQESLLIDYPTIPRYHDLHLALAEDFDGFIIATPADTHFTIAEKITFPEDRKWIEFHINKNAYFSDGKKISPSDVLFSFNQLREIFIKTVFLCFYHYTPLCLSFFNQTSPS